MTRGATAQDTLSITLDEVRYIQPVSYFNIATEGQQLKMAYLDCKSTKPNGKTVMLFHGKNFGGYYWTNVIKYLNNAGYRVIAPDQIGFGKSSKAFIHYSFHQLAKWNKELLDSLGVAKVALLGHSMGGMLATRFTLMYPEKVSKLILENPIGLEDYKTFVPYTNSSQQYQTELKATAESIKKYYQTSYFTKWEQKYDELVRIAAGVTYSADFPRWAKVAALTFTMIYEQPVLYEFSNLKVPTALFIGQEDKTIVGKGLLTPAEQAKHGQYKLLGRAVADLIPNGKLIRFEGVGHIPHLESPDQFLPRLLSEIR